MVYPSMALTPDPKKNNVCQFKCHCDSVYIGRTSQIFHLRKAQNSPKCLRNWMANKGNKSTNCPSEIRDHLLNDQKCFKHYIENKFTILTKGRNIYYLSFFESLLIKTYKLCNQKFV